MDIVNQLEELERTGKKEHVVFLVSQRPVAAAAAVAAEADPAGGDSSSRVTSTAQSLQPRRTQTQVVNQP